MSDEATNPDQEQEDVREKELAEEREHRETVLGSGEEREQDVVDPVETAFPAPEPPGDMEPDLALEEEVAQEPDPAGTTAEDV